MRTLVATLVAALALSGLAAPPAGAATSFADTPGSVHEADIEALATSGITRGCNPPANDRYCPDEPVTRGQMAAFLVRALKLRPAGGDMFTDDNGSVFEADINALAAAGVTKGCNPPRNDRYCPDEPVTRGQMAAFLVRALKLPSDHTDIFTDDGSVFEGDIDSLAVAGITRGCNPPDNTRYCPDQPVTRAQMASFLVRALDLRTGGGDDGGSGGGGGGKEPSGGTFAIHYLAVRQGDAALYVGACGEVGLIDANRYRSAEVLAALDQIGTRHLKWIAVSHYDADHLGAVVDVATAPGVTVGKVYDRGGDRNAHSSATYRSYYDWVTAAGLRQPVSKGDVFTLCDGSQKVTFKVVSPNADGTVGSGLAVSDENDRSVCLHVEFRRFDAVSCGDINGVDDGSRTDVESALASAIGDVEVGKVNHHGSAYSSNQTWVDALSAEVAVISVGPNSYGHPSPAVVNRWRMSGADVFQTGRPDSQALVDGDVVVVTDGTNSFTATASASGRSVHHPVDSR